MSDPPSSVSKRHRPPGRLVAGLLVLAAALACLPVAVPRREHVSVHSGDLGMTVSFVAPGNFIQITSLRDPHVDLAMMRRDASDPLTQLVRRLSPAAMDRVDETIDFRFRPDGEPRALAELLADEVSGKRTHGASPAIPTVPLAAGSAIPAPLADSRTTWRTIPTGYGAVISCRNPNAGFLYEMTPSGSVQITARAVERRYVLCFRQPDGRYRVMGSVYYRGDARCDREANDLAMEMLQSLALTPDRN